MHPLTSPRGTWEGAAVPVRSMEPPSYPCDHCGHDTRRLLLCGTCENVSYCGRACQRAEWPTHKAYCRTRGQQHLRLARNAMNQTSPSWRLHRVGEYLDGVEVTDTHTSLGKVLRATRPFSVGDLVLAEMPLLVCPNKTDYCFLAAYVHADAATRAAVLELYHPPLDSPEALTFVNLAETMCTRARVWGGEMSPSLAAHLLLISQVNAHAFRAADPDIGDTVMSALHPNQSDDLPPSAVFRVASKAQHSCSPNVHYSSTSGRLENVATRDIPTGAAIEFSYTSAAPEMIRSARQAELRRTKYFDCTCARCMGKDVCRPLECPRCDNAWALCTGSTWRCETCKKTIAAEDLKAAMALETALERNLDNAKEQMLVAGKSPSTIRAMGMARDAIAEFLSPLHYLQFESLKLVATTAAFLAREMDAKSIFTTEVNPKVAYKRAAETWRDLVRRREHASAVIEGRLTFDDACRRLHELNPPWDVAVPSLQCSSNEAFYAGVDFLKAGCPREAADIFRRHLDGILFSLSPIDPDADFVRDVVSKHSS